VPGLKQSTGPEAKGLLGFGFSCAFRDAVDELVQPRTPNARLGSISSLEESRKFPRKESGFPLLS
jgi:hypothetical protein